MGLAIADLVQVTWQTLQQNPLRSGLSMLGVFMGVGAVTATLQVGTISRAVIARELANREAPQVTLYPRWEPNQPYAPLQPDDLIYLQQRLVNYQALSGSAWAGAPTALFQDQQATPFMRAVTVEFPQTTGRSLRAGRFFTPGDFDKFRAVVVIDEFLANSLFLAPPEAALGQRIYLDQRPYTVVGVIETKVEEDEPPEGEVFLPLPLFFAMTGESTLDWVQIRPTRLDQVDELDQQAQSLLQQRYATRRFGSWNNVTALQERQAVLNLASRGLAAVGLISLLVGGVGIANIMIASVAERTAEIGLRRAIGATQADILRQFMLEAILLSLVGGGTAIGVVHGFTQVVADRFDLPYTFAYQTALIAMGAAVGVGLGASVFPALQASRLDPVQALRSG